MHIHLYHTCPILTKTNLLLRATSRDIFFLFGFLAFSFTSPWFQFFGTAWGNSRVQNRSRNEQTLSYSLPRHSLREGLILAKAFLTGLLVRSAGFRWIPSLIRRTLFVVILDSFQKAARWWKLIAPLLWTFLRIFFPLSVLKRGFKLSLLVKSTSLEVGRV